MTTETDKLVEMARAAGFTISNDLVKMLAAFKAAIIADLAADVEPVAHMWQHDETGRTGFVEHAPAEELEQWERINKPRRFVAKLYSASTVAALKARVAELERALERIANPILYEQANVPEGYSLDGRALLAQINRPEYYQGVARAALTKGQPAPQPQQEQSN